MKKKTNSLEQFQKSRRKIVKTGRINTLKVETDTSHMTFKNI